MHILDLLSPIFVLFQIGDIEGNRYTAGQLCKVDALRISAEEGSKRLLFLNVVRVKDDGFFAESANNI